MGFGGKVFTGDSKLFIGPLGVVEIGFKGYDLGKTTADTTLVPDQDIKDITYQQDGTKAADHVKTGIDYILNAVFGEISTGLLAVLMPGISSSEPTGDNDGGILSRSIFKSMLDNEAGVMKVAAVNEHGIPETGLDHILNFYKVIPIISGDLINWGVDTQRNLPVEFRIKYYEFPEDSYAVLGAFGYWGVAATENVPPIVWPDVEAPKIVSAICDKATGPVYLLLVTFHEVIAFQDAFAAEHYSLKLNGEYEAPTAGSIENNGGIATVLQLTFTGPWTGLTDVVEINISEDALEDGDANPFLGVDSYPCTPWDEVEPE